MTTDWTTEYARLQQGHRHDHLTPPPWWRDHDGSTPPPLTEAELREAEADLGVTFPAEYRDYLLHHTAAGRMRHLHRGPHGWGWHGDTETNYHLLPVPFPHPDSYATYDAELGHREPPRDDVAAWQAWDDECGVLEELKTAGAVFLQEHGCGFSTWLVVTGPHHGELWFDARATCDRLLPLRRKGRPATFKDWLDHPSMDMVAW